MKHAFLIYAHEEPLVLHTLLRLLDHERNEIFLHLDPRNSVLPSVLSPSPLSRAKLHLLAPAQRVSWGDYSQIEVELCLFAQALQVGPFAHYHLISGVDLPIKPMVEIHAFFDAHPTTEFLGFWNDEVHQRDLERRTHRYYFFTQYLKRAPHPRLRNMVAGATDVDSAYVSSHAGSRRDLQADAHCHLTLRKKYLRPKRS